MTASGEAGDAAGALSLLESLGINEPSRPATRDSMRRTWSAHSDTANDEATPVHLPASAPTEQARNVGAAAQVDREAMEIGQYWLEMIRITLNEHQQAPTGPYRLATSIPPPHLQGAKHEWGAGGEDSCQDHVIDQDKDRQGTHDAPHAQVADAGQRDLVAVLGAGFNSLDQDEKKAADMPPSASRPESSGRLRHAQHVSRPDDSWHVARPDSPPVAWLAKIDRPVSFTARASRHSLEQRRLSLSVSCMCGHLMLACTPICQLQLLQSLTRGEVLGLEFNGRSWNA